MAHLNGNESFVVDKQDMIEVIRGLRQKTGTVESAKTLSDLTENINSLREDNGKLKSQIDEKYNTIQKLEAELNALQENENKMTSVINGLENGKFL